jgi:hypothetical protein
MMLLKGLMGLNVICILNLEVKLGLNQLLINLILYMVHHLKLIAWLTENLTLAADYDRENVNNLVYSIPEFIREDSNNANYELFVEMIGQHFDTIWTLLKI